MCLDGAAVCRHRVPGLHRHHVPRHQLAHRKLQPLTVAQRPASVRHHRLQRLRRAFRRVLLGETDDGVQDDHAQNGEGKLQGAQIAGLLQFVRDERDPRSDDEHHREQVGELRPQLPPHACPP